MGVKQRNQINFSDLPQQLITSNQWVLWKYEKRNGKKTKVPYQVDGSPAQANNRRTWSSFHTAVKFYTEYEEFDGIGFVFSKQDNFIGIDIDGCVKDGEINEFAQDIIDELDSYTEISPSGTGIHIIVEGELPKEITGTGKKNAKTGLEIYSHGRFFTMTGISEINDQVYERTDELAEIFEKNFDKTDVNRVSFDDVPTLEMKWSDEELLEKMFNSKNGHKIRELYEGTHTSGDHSSDDLALCNHLAFWTGRNTTSIDRIFRGSALFRDKWDIVHHSSGETYGERTISIAISTTPSTIFDSDVYSVYIENEKDWWTINTNGTRTLQHSKIAEYITDQYDFVRYPSEHGDVFFFNEKEGVFESDSSGRQLRSIIRVLEPSLKTSQIKEISEYIKDMSPVRREVATDVIAVNNGLLDLDTFELKPFSSDYFVKTKIYTNYDAAAYNAFVDSTLEKVSDGYEPTIENIKEMFACVLYPGLLVPKMFYLYGRSAHNGKSSLINMIQYTFNKKGDSISAVTPQKLATSPFASASMYGKLGNVVDDQPNKVIEDSGVLKSILSGNVVEIERKGKNSESVRIVTTMITASNFYPNFTESGKQINRRLYIIPFEHDFSSDKDLVSDGESAERLQSKSACEYVLKLAVEALARMLKMKKPDKLTYNPKVEKMGEGFAEFNDPMNDYFDEYNKTYFEKATGRRTYNDYMDWARENGIVPFDMKCFKELVTKKYDLEWTTKRVNINGVSKSVKGFKKP